MKGLLSERLAGLTTEVDDISVKRQFSTSPAEMDSEGLPTDQSLASEKFVLSKKLNVQLKEQEGKKLSVYLLCAGQVTASADKGVELRLGFVSDKEKPEPSRFFPHPLVKDQQAIVSSNQLFHFETAGKFELILKGFAPSAVAVKEVEAFCVKFDDSK